jgi:hypothetical protein
MNKLVPDEFNAVGHPESIIKIVNANPGVKLMDLQTPLYGNDPNELIKHRFLYRGGILVMTGPTGAGKSSFTMQWSICLAGGIGLFGLKIGDCYYQKGLKVLVIQAENDAGDLAEQRDGVLSVISADVIERASENLSFVTMPDASGEVFSERLSALCEYYTPDVVFIDPVFSFLGGDNNAQKDVSNWVRNLILPVLMKFKCSAVMIHHNNKPQKDAIKSGAYTMAGSAEWANAARAVLTLEPVGDGVYALSAVKRGDRLGWKDENGSKTLTKHIAYHGGQDTGGRPIIAWRDATSDEIGNVNGSSTSGCKCKIKDLIDIIEANTSVHKTTISQQDLITKVRVSTGASERTIRSVLKEGIDLKVLNAMMVGKSNYIGVQ